MGDGVQNGVFVQCGGFGNACPAVGLAETERVLFVAVDHGHLAGDVDGGFEQLAFLHGEIHRLRLVFKRVENDGNPYAVAICAVLCLESGLDAGVGEVFLKSGAEGLQRFVRRGRHEQRQRLVQRLYDFFRKAQLVH